MACLVTVILLAAAATADPLRVKRGHFGGDLASHEGHKVATSYQNFNLKSYTHGAIGQSYTSLGGHGVSLGSSGVGLAGNHGFSVESLGTSLGDSHGVPLGSSGAGIENHLALSHESSGAAIQEGHGISFGTVGLGLESHGLSDGASAIAGGHGLSLGSVSISSDLEGHGVSLDGGLDHIDSLSSLHGSETDISGSTGIHH